MQAISDNIGWLDSNADLKYKMFALFLLTVPTSQT